MLSQLTRDRATRDNVKATLQRLEPKALHPLSLHEQQISRGLGLEPSLNLRGGDGIGRRVHLNYIRTEPGPHDHLLLLP